MHFETILMQAERLGNEIQDIFYGNAWFEQESESFEGLWVNLAFYRESDSWGHCKTSVSIQYKSWKLKFFENTNIYFSSCFDRYIYRYTRIHVLDSRQVLLILSNILYCSIISSVYWHSSSVQMLFLKPTYGCQNRNWNHGRNLNNPVGFHCSCFWDYQVKIILKQVTCWCCSRFR